MVSHQTKIGVQKTMNNIVKVLKEKKNQPVILYLTKTMSLKWKINTFLNKWKPTEVGANKTLKEECLKFFEVKRNERSWNFRSIGRKENWKW